MKPATNAPAVPDARPFEQTIGGKKTALYVLQNRHGVQAVFTNYGARWVSLLMTDKNGQPADVV
ncbi:MAG: galactose-1-epimerase, partial [Chitinophagaceae bacterium]